MLKILCVLLSLTVAVMGAITMYTLKAGHLPNAAPEEELVEAEQPSGAEGDLAEGEPHRAFGELFETSQMGLIDELVESLKVEHQKIGDVKLRLDKREKNLQELYESYLKMRGIVEKLSKDLETRLIKVDKKQMENFKVLAGVYSKMSPASAARSLKYMEPDRVALVLNQMDSRAMAALMDAAVTATTEGSEIVAEWADAIRRLNDTDTP